MGERESEKTNVATRTEDETMRGVQKQHSFAESHNQLLFGFVTHIFIIFECKCHMLIIYLFVNWSLVQGMDMINRRERYT